MARGNRARLTRAEGLKFGLTVGTALAALGGLLLWRGHDRIAFGLLVAGGLLGSAAMAAPTRLGPIERAWMGMAHAVSRVTTPIFMSLVYFLVITPVGLLRRLFGRNPLRHDPVGGSHWISHESREKESLRRQF